MKIAAAVTVLVLATAVSSRAQHPGPPEYAESTSPALIPLFISCDLKTQFTTPSLDERALLWLETPVSREGARMLLESRKRRGVAQVPLVLEAGSSRMESAPIAPLDANGGHGSGRIRLLAGTDRGLYIPAKAVMPARTESSTWVRIRALSGH